MEDTNNDKDKGNDIRVRSSRRNTHVSRQTEKNLKYRRDKNYGRRDTHVSRQRERI